VSAVAVLESGIVELMWLPPLKPRLLPALSFLAGAVLLSIPAHAIEHAGPENVVLIVNQASVESALLAQVYREARGVPEGNVCVVEASTEYGITYLEYQDTVAGPVAACLDEKGLKEQALFLVLTRGVPAIITDVGEVVASVQHKALDGFLCDPFDEIPDHEAPYHHQDLSFTRENGFAGYLVTRLDGPSYEAAAALVTRAVTAELAGDFSDGVGYFDLEPHGSNPIEEEVIASAGPEGNGQIQASHDLIADAGWPVVLDELDAQLGTPPALEHCPDARWFHGWYRLNHYNAAFDWLPGAVGVHIDSWSAINYRSGKSWCPGAIEAGITATAGAIWEPYIQRFIEGDVFLDGMAVRGLSLAEAAWRAIPRREWMMVVFGDPLLSTSRQYPGTTLPEIPPLPGEPEPEPETEATSEPGPEEVVEIDLPPEPEPEPGPEPEARDEDMGEGLVGDAAAPQEIGAGETPADAGDLHDGRGPIEEGGTGQGGSSGCALGGAGAQAWPLALLLIWLCALSGTPGRGPLGSRRRSPGCTCRP
jgi:uncharacterized protein (TIGR03790 family)